MPHPLPQAPPRPIRRSITVPPPRRSPTCGRLLCLKRHHIRFVVAPPSLRLALTLSLLRRKYAAIIKNLTVHVDHLMLYFLSSISKRLTFILNLRLIH
ncbi:hypothetical protein DAI22_06g106500 [Oryza sativa Japonica Group]|nr:hypothetical protein DAI22_06g106500 [Oryza sativa Japonica Group]